MARYIWSREPNRNLILPTARMNLDFESKGYQVHRKFGSGTLWYPKDPQLAIAIYKKPGLFVAPRVLIWRRDERTARDVRQIAEHHTPDVLELPRDTPDIAWYTIENSFDEIYNLAKSNPRITWAEIKEELDCALF